jgi:hypothetical protein
MNFGMAVRVMRLRSHGGGGAAPLACWLSDSGTHAPPNYNTFAAPASEGGAYVDPVFGSTIRRISKTANHLSPNSPFDPWIAIGNVWSGVNSFNADNTKILLKTNGPTGIFSTAGGVLHWINYDFAPLAGITDCLWSHTNPNLLYYCSPTDDPYYTGADVAGSAELRSFNIDTQVDSLVHSFHQYAALATTSEDLSPDGNYIALLGNGRHSFWYRISDDTVGTVIDRVTTYGYTVGEKGSQYMIGPADNTGAFVMADFHSAPNVVHVLRPDTMAERFTIQNFDHRAFGLDIDNSPIMISDHYTGCAGGQYSVNKDNLVSAVRTVICLPVASYQDWYYAIPHNMPGWMLVTHIIASGDPDPSLDWIPFMQEIFLMSLDGTQVRRLAHHRCRPADYTETPHAMLYGSRPKSCISLDGKKIAFGSNYNQVNPTPDPGSPDYQDTYIIEVC